VAADNKADEEWRERLARALWKVDREDMPENSVIHSISPLDEGWGYLEQADAVLSSIDAAGCVIAPKEPTKEIVHARRRPHRTGGPAMTKTAEERAREIVAEWDK